MRYLALVTCLLFIPTLADANALTINLGNIATPGEIPLPALDHTPLDGSLLALTITWTAANIVSSYGFLDADLVLYPVASGPSSITTGGGTGYFLDGANHQITPTITMIHNGGIGSIVYDLI